MKTELTAERLREVLHYNPVTGVFTWRVSRSNVHAGDEAGSDDGNGYVQIRLFRATYRAHRLAWLYVYGTWPEGMVDHENRNKSDNRIDNLRLADDSQNAQNTPTRSNNRSGYRGVYWHARAKKWAAEINAYGCQKYLGLFGTPEDAHTAYLMAAAGLHTHNPLVTSSKRP